MLPKNKRVTKDTFQTIMEKGSILHGSFFMFRYIKDSIPSYAFIAPKKIAKRAVLRNSLRRKGYNILRFYNLKLGSGLFFYKKEALNAHTLDIKNDIENILKRSKII